METSPPSSIPIPVPAVALILHLSSPSSHHDDPHNGTWRPYSNAADFDANVGMILIILVCALLSALALNAAIRFLLHRSRHPTQTQTQPTPDRLPDTNPSKLTNAADATRAMAPPMLVFPVGMKLAGAEAECAICLSEFVDGERVRVLPRCQHGFHVNCIQEWLSSHSSCPTCRSNYLLSTSPDKKPSSHDGDDEVDVESPPELS